MTENNTLEDANSLIDTIKRYRKNEMNAKDFRKQLYDLDTYCTMNNKANYDEISDFQWFNFFLMELQEYVVDGLITFHEFNYIFANINAWVNGCSNNRNPINIDLVRDVFDTKYIPPPKTLSRYSRQANSLRIKGVQFSSTKIFKQQALGLAFKTMNGLLAVGATKREAAIFSAYLVMKIWGDRCGLKKIPYKASVIKKRYNAYSKLIIDGESQTDNIKMIIESNPCFKKGWLDELNSFKNELDIESLPVELVGDE